MSIQGIEINACPLRCGLARSLVTSPVDADAAFGVREAQDRKRQPEDVIVMPEELRRTHEHVSDARFVCILPSRNLRRLHLVRRPDLSLLNGSEDEREKAMLLVRE